MIRPKLIDFVLICLTAAAVWGAAHWLWASLGVLAAVGAALAVGLLLNVMDGVLQALRMGTRHRVDSTRR